MALENIVSNLVLDVYDHDTTPTSIKSIACDDNTRYVAAELNYSGVPYYLPEEALIELTILRPDKTGVSITGTTFAFTVSNMDDEGAEVVTTEYGAYGELDAASLAVAGTLLGQFKITQGDQVLRTEIFNVNNGRALDAEISDWAGTYQGYNLDEIVEKVDFVVAAMKTLTGSDVDVDKAILETHQYIENRISVHDGGIYINS